MADNKPKTVLITFSNRDELRVHIEHEMTSCEIRDHLQVVFDGDTSGQHIIPTGVWGRERNTLVRVAYGNKDNVLGFAWISPAHIVSMEKR